MGAICQSKDQNTKNYKRKQQKANSVTNMNGKIKTTTKNINKANDECLILFVDTQCSVRKNQYLNAINENVSLKIQNYLDVQLKTKCMNPGDCLLIQVQVQDLKFKQVVILCINVWEGAGKGLQDPLQQDIEHALNSILQKGITSVCITNYNSQIGIPTNVGDKLMARALIKKQKQFNSITIACVKEQHQRSTLQAVQNQRNATIQGANRNKSLGNSIKSDYY